VEVPDLENMPYRQGVNAFVVDSDNHFLLVNKRTYGENQWDVPGGGLEKGETLEEGVLRELTEELGIADFKVLKECSLINRFEWPVESQERGFEIYGTWHRGQEKHQFLVRFIGNKENIKIQEAEIKQIKWVSYSQLQNHLVFKNQWETAKATLAEFGITSD
jgi:putative (di)nucleoside polyphosphate hydrolase